MCVSSAIVHATYIIDFQYWQWISKHSLGISYKASRPRC